ncbi:hypothetical protein C4564_01790 [Candidatus Microgenomates bacterium]|nr:MAG: hypothetical protein C4564_01790 [Candidatus Microgenomates bacterium]
MSKTLKLIVNLLLHIGAIAAIIIAFFPLAKWYFDANPLWGVDFFYTASMVNLLKDNFALPWSAWNYQWFAGWPLLITYPILQYYLVLPFTLFFHLIAAVKIWMLVSLGLFFTASYACFYVVSKNQIFAALFAIASAYTVGTYGTLMWGGSLPSHATILFFPLTLLFIIIYLKKLRRKYILLASLSAGLSIWAHPQITIAYILPSAAILLFFAFGMGKIKQRIIAFALFCLVTLIIGTPQLAFSLGSLGGTIRSMLATNTYKDSVSTAKVAIDEQVIEFTRQQPLRLVTDTNKTVFLLLGAGLIVFILGFTLKPARKKLLSVVPFLALVVYYVGYVYLFSFGISIYHGGWYRLFWATPLVMGLLGGSLWGAGQQGFKQRFRRVGTILVIKASLVILAAGIFGLVTFSKDLRERIVARSTPSSAYPDIVSMRPDSEGFEQLQEEIVPSWFDPMQKNFRLYSADQTMNIWWNAVFPTPLLRGYFDPPGADYFFWLDAALNEDSDVGEDQLVAAFDYPPEISHRNREYLVDWYAVKYFEAGHPGSTVYAPLPADFDTDDYFVEKEELDLNYEKFTHGNMLLQYYELYDDYVTPILLATNAKTLGVIATDQGYDTMMRVLADINIPSMRLIPIKLGENINDVKNADLSFLDGLIVYDYRYGNRGNAFTKLADFVRSGKPLFIDTGTELKEAEDQNLPEIFPFSASDRKPLGSDWDLTEGDSALLQDISTTQFDPLIFDNKPWSLSFPREPENLREGADVILAHQEKPVLISYSVGNGTVIWSGMNLPYHVIRQHNLEEVDLFANILAGMFTIPETTVVDLPKTDVDFVSAQKREITSSNATGILFKEMAYPGWQASIQKIENGRSVGRSTGLKVYSAGPANPGFMYVRVPENYQKDTFKVTLRYGGSRKLWLLSMLSIIVILGTLEYGCLDGRIWGRKLMVLAGRMRKHTAKWWHREDA